MKGQAWPSSPLWSQERLSHPIATLPSDASHSACPNPVPASFCKVLGLRGEAQGNSGHQACLWPCPQQAMPCTPTGQQFTVSPLRPACFLLAHLPLHVSGFCHPQGQRATLAQQLAGAEQSAGDGGSWGWLGLGRQCLVWDTAGTELPGPGL